MGGRKSIHLYHITSRRVARRAFFFFFLRFFVRARWSGRSAELEGRGPAQQASALCLITSIAGMRGCESCDM